MGNMCGSGSAKQGNQSWVDKRIEELMRQKESNPSEVVHPFNKILLKFPVIRLVFQRVKEVFDACDKTGTGTMRYADLQEAMTTLGATCTPAEITAIFSDADRWNEGKLNFREFLVCLALGHLLGFIPLNDKTAASAGDADVVRPTPVEAATAAAAGDQVPPSPSAAQVLALINESRPTPMVESPTAATAAASHEPFHVHIPSTGILHTGQLDAASGGTPSNGNASAASKRHSRRTSFTTEEARLREGDSSVAAMIAVASAASLHEAEARKDARDSPAAGRSPTSSGDASPVHEPSISDISVPPLNTQKLGPSEVRRKGSDAAFAILSSRRGTGDVNDPNLVAWAFHLCLEAFLQLSSGGVIRRDDLARGIRQLAMMSPSKERHSEVHAEGFRTSSGTEVAPHNARQKPAIPVSALEFLTEDRFAELDWDADGQITFREFLFAFVNWTGVEDVESDDGKE